MIGKDFKKDASVVRSYLEGLSATDAKELENRVQVAYTHEYARPVYARYIRLIFMVSQLGRNLRQVYVI